MEGMTPATKRPRSSSAISSATHTSALTSWNEQQEQWLTLEKKRFDHEIDLKMKEMETRQKELDIRALEAQTHNKQTEVIVAQMAASQKQTESIMKQMSGQMTEFAKSQERMLMMVLESMKK